MAFLNLLLTNTLLHLCSRFACRCFSNRPATHTRQTTAAKPDATSHGEVIVGAIALAAPTFNHNGEVAGCVGMFGPQARVKDSDIPRFGALVMHAANAISLQSGYRAGPDARAKPAKSRRV